VPFDPLVDKLTSNSSSQFQQMRESIAKCWHKKMAQVRGSSLCYTCSGRSTSFFEGNKALITPAACEDILKECTPSLEMIVELIEGAPKMWSLIQERLRQRALKSGLPIDFNKEIEGKMSMLFSKVNSNEVHSLLKRYHELKGSSDRKKISEINAELCSRFVDLRETPFLAKFIGLFIPFSRVYYQINAFYDQGMLKTYQLLLTKVLEKEEKLMREFNSHSPDIKKQKEKSFHKTVKETASQKAEFKDKIEKWDALFKKWQNVANDNIAKRVKELEDAESVYRDHSRQLSSLQQDFRIGNQDSLFAGDTKVLATEISKVSTVVSTDLQPNNWDPSGSQKIGQSLDTTTFKF
jgi:hypothetical protein